jgi:hypothetical protein
VGEKVAPLVSELMLLLYFATSGLHTDVDTSGPLYFGERGTEAVALVMPTTYLTEHIGLELLQIDKSASHINIRSPHEGYGPKSYDIKRLWTQKFTFKVDGPN